MNQLSLLLPPFRLNHGILLCCVNSEEGKKIHNLLFIASVNRKSEGSGRNETFSGSGPNFDAAISHLQNFFSEVCCRALCHPPLSLSHSESFVCQRSPGSRPSSTVEILLIALCSVWSFKSFAVAVDTNFAFRWKFCCKAILNKLAAALKATWINYFMSQGNFSLRIRRAVCAKRTEAHKHRSLCK